MKTPEHFSNNSISLKMTPMIDVVFLLLVYFIWTSSFEIPEFDLPSAVALPPQGGIEATDQQPPIEPFDEIVVRLSRKDAQLLIELNEQPIATFDMLQGRLAQIIAIGVQPPIIIHPAADVTMNAAVNAFDAAKRAGVDRVLFAAQSE